MLPPWLTLLFMLLLAGVLACSIGTLLLALAILRPARMMDGKALAVLGRLSPGDLKLVYELMDFDVVDERRGKPLHIAGWWIPAKHAAQQTAILIHGYADAKVGAIASAPVWHGLGWNVLAIDLRAHGESGGVDTTGGYYERHDVTQVINQLRILKPEQTGRLALFGASMGAAIAVATAVLMEEGIDALVLDSPIADYRETVIAHARMIGSPMFLMRPAIRLGEWFTKSKISAVRTVDLIGAVRCPIFIIRSGQDALISESAMRALAESIELRGPETLDQIWRVESAEHLQALAVEPVQYGENLRQWLESIRLR